MVITFCRYTVANSSIVFLKPIEQASVPDVDALHCHGCVSEHMPLDQKPAEVATH